MLKKAAHIILAIYLMTTIVGFTVTQHYCGDRLVSTQIDAMDECGCDMNASDLEHNACGMCDIETEYVHLSVNFVVEHSLELNPVLDFMILQNTLSIDESNDFQLAFHAYPNSSPPVLSVSRRLALIQSFRC